MIAPILATAVTTASKKTSTSRRSNLQTLEERILADKSLKNEHERYLAHIVDPTVGLAKFAEDMFGHRLTCKMPEFHRNIYSRLTSTTRLACAAPRSFAKTTLVDVIYPCYLALLAIPTRNNIALFSATQSLTIEQLKKVKWEYDNNEALKNLYIKTWRMLPHTPAETWREEEIQFTNGVLIQARGAGGQTRGKRPNVVICDDLETTEGVRSPDQRKYLDEWFRKDILGLLEPTGQLIVIGTILHHASLLRLLITEMKQHGWRTEKYQAYKGGIQEKGYELWPEKWTHEQLQRRKAEQGSTYFSAEYMNEPVDDATAPIRAEHIRYWQELPDKYSMCIAVDPAYSEDAKADWKVAVLVACDSKNNRYLVKYIRTHNSQADFFNAILNMWKLNKHCISSIGIPNQGLEKSFFDSFLKFCEEKMVFPPIHELKNRGVGNNTNIKGKKERIIATLQPIFEQGKYYIHATHEEAKEELLGIGYTRNDDLCFVAGTQIATVKGLKNIEDVKEGDRVITPQGTQKVIQSNYNGFKKVISKLGLTATPNHKVYSLVRGFASMDSIKFNEDVSKLTLKEILKWKYQKLLISMEKPINSWVAKEDIISLQRVPMRGGRILKDFMWRFGSLIINRRFLKATMFTIKMATLLITTSLIFSAFHVGNTISSLKRLIRSLYANTCRILDISLPHGINHQKDMLGTWSTPEKCKKTSSSKKDNVTSAKRYISINTQPQNTVPKTVTKNKEEEGYGHVYNLTVENEGVYYANGVLVSNCDAMTYAEQLIQPSYTDVVYNYNESSNYNSTIDFNKIANYGME